MLKRMRNTAREELRGWKMWEAAWLLISCSVIFGLSVYWKDTPVGIISAISGVACVVLTGKGKLSAYVFGLINTVLYAYIAWKARYYGEVMLNVIYYLPMQFYGMYVWSHNMNPQTHEVRKQRMSAKARILVSAAILLTTGLYGLLLRRINGSLPFVDAFSTVASIAAMLISIRMYMEQWMIWIVVDAVTVFMWCAAFAGGNESVATLLMWIVYLVNAIVMHVKWAGEARRNV